VDAVLVRLIETTNPTVIRADEGKIPALERRKTSLHDQIAHRKAPAPGTFEEKLEPALQFLATPLKIWESSQITLQRMVLKLTFTDRTAYHRNKGDRTPQTALYSNC
jgi:site-specific DNA recombinase